MKTYGLTIFYIRFYFSGERSVYFNIREDDSVIQVSLKRGECNLFYNLLATILFTMLSKHSLVSSDDFTLMMIQLLIYINFDNGKIIIGYNRT